MQMTAPQFRTALAAIGLNQSTFAAWAGISVRSASGYARGEYNVPEITAKLLRVMVELKLKPEDVK